MTAQISDRFIYRDQDYSLAGVNGEGLFEPSQYGLRPVAMCSACWRGYPCTYVIRDNQLLLEQLGISHGLEGGQRGKLTAPPPLNGRTAEAARGRGVSVFGHKYTGLALPIRFSGGLLLARDFIEELYVHMGFHPAWKFREIHELILKDGQLSQAYDRSSEMAGLRDGMQGKGECGDSEQIAAWIDRCFSLKYDW